MSDDWQVGDLALCVDGSPRKRVGRYNENGANYRLTAGKIYTVDRIDFEDGYTGLHFDGYEWAWLASRFRKIRPHAPDEEDAETIRLMNGARAPA